MKDMIRIPKLLVPNDTVDMRKWSVVACDQYTSEPEYWHRAKEYIGDSPSTLNIIFPEAYLEDNEEERIKDIHDHMLTYEKQCLIQKEGFVLIERTLRDKRIRKGLLISIDLEAYDYTPFTSAPIRATEGTVMDRLPPRIRIRKGAALESPHIMFLIDDKKRTVIEPLFDELSQMSLLYEFELMEDSGHLKGHLIHTKKMTDHIIHMLSLLEKDGFLFAVGDGNHSLATAKEIWKNIKPGLDDAMIQDHPARYALVEVVNLYDDSLVFEPIHRVLFNGADFIRNAVVSDTPVEMKDMHRVEYISNDRRGYMYFTKETHNLPVGALQAAIDNYLAANKASRVDYIHGEDVVYRLSVGDNTGFILPPMQKHELFETVIKDGVLPRKTFSMGEAHDKRFYLECRRILP